jgi:hypothetical protein
MKVRIITAACSLLIVVAAFTTAFMLPSGRLAFMAATKSVSAQTFEDGYTVKLYGGKIGIFAKGDSKPEEVLGVSPDSLPKSEQERLAAGIHVKTHDELLALIENYTG